VIPDTRALTPKGTKVHEGFLIQALSVIRTRRCLLLIS
jgi:hypothetical protein